MLRQSNLVDRWGWKIENWTCTKGYTSANWDLEAWACPSRKRRIAKLRRQKVLAWRRVPHAQPIQESKTQGNQEQAQEEGIQEECRQISFTIQVTQES